MPSPVQESLIALVHSIHAAITPSKDNSGNNILGKYDLTLTSDGSLQVPDTTPVRSVADGTVDLGLVLKNVRFTNTDITDLSTVGGMPIQEFATQLLNGSATTAGIPGLLGSLKGKVPVVVDSIGSALAVQIQVRLNVRDDHDQPDGYFNWSFSDGSAGVGGQGTSTPSTSTPSVIPPLPTGTLQWRLPLPGSVFVGAFTELKTNLAQTGDLPVELANRTVIVEVNLSAAGVSTGWIALEPVTIMIPAIPIPTLVAFFDDVLYNGSEGQNGTLILLPDDSPLNPAVQPATTLRDLLNTALGTLSTLINGLVTNATGTDGFNPFNPLAPLAGIITNLATDLTAQKSKDEIHFSRQSLVPYLDSGFPIHDGDWATDRISSMLVLGPMGLTVHCFNNWHFDSSGGAFDVRVGLEMGVGVPDLTSSNPLTVPPGDLTVTSPPLGGGTGKNPIGFNDLLSSVQIVKP